MNITMYFLRQNPRLYMYITNKILLVRLYIFVSRPAPTYETATTREFYRGRTETLRSCTSETVEWIKAMLSPDTNVSSFWTADEVGSGCNPSDLYLGGASFESWTWHLLPWWKCFIAFFSPPGECWDSIVERPWLPPPSSFLIHHSLIILLFDTVYSEIVTALLNEL
jgi:hypothetical protein